MPYAQWSIYRPCFNFFLSSFFFCSCIFVVIGIIILFFICVFVCRMLANKTMMSKMSCSFICSILIKCSRNKWNYQIIRQMCYDTNESTYESITVSRCKWISVKRLSSFFRLFEYLFYGPFRHRLIPFQTNCDNWRIVYRVNSFLLFHIRSSLTRKFCSRNVTSSNRKNLESVFAFWFHLVVQTRNEIVSMIRKKRLSCYWHQSIRNAIKIWIHCLEFIVCSTTVWNKK